mgnify:CR=1 FL=1
MNIKLSTYNEEIITIPRCYINNETSGLLYSMLEDYQEEDYQEDDEKIPLTNESCIKETINFLILFWEKFLINPTEEFQKKSVEQKIEDSCLYFKNDLNLNKVEITSFINCCNYLDCD